MSPLLTEEVTGTQQGCPLTTGSAGPPHLYSSGFLLPDLLAPPCVWFLHHVTRDIFFSLLGNLSGQPIPSLLPVKYLTLVYLSQAAWWSPYPQVLPGKLFFPKSAQTTAPLWSLPRHSEFLFLQGSCSLFVTALNIPCHWKSSLFPKHKHLNSWDTFKSILQSVTSSPEAGTQEMFNKYPLSVTCLDRPLEN